MSNIDSKKVAEAIKAGQTKQVATKVTGLQMLSKAFENIHINKKEQEKDDKEQE
jgi:hypothetical protein